MAKKPKPADKADTAPQIFDLNLPDSTIAGMVKRRAKEAQGHWNTLYGLDKLRKDNHKIAYAENEAKKPRDQRYQDVYSDNINFKAKRTILAFVAGQVSSPEVMPADATDIAATFASDFEKVLFRTAEAAGAKPKIKLAVSDLMDGQRIGVLKWTYNFDKKKLELHYCKPESIIIGSRSGYLEEPDFVQHTQKRTIAKLLQQFPDANDKIYREAGIDRGVPSQLEVEKEMTENWIFVEDENKVKLAVVFMLNDVLLGKMTDPNWNEGGKNILDEHMVPFIFFNMLNDGAGWIDNTSFLEQAQYNQSQYNTRGNTISENARYAGIGVPVFAGGSIKEETAAQLQFSPIQRVILEDNGMPVSNAFTVWNAQQLQQFVFEDKNKLEQSVYDTYGTNQVQTGGDAQTNTLGQAVLLRNQAEGRQQEFIDAIDAAMTRFYKLESQMIYRYYDETQYVSVLGNDGKFEQVAISQKKISDNFGMQVNVKSGTNIPVDRAQKTAQALELAKMNKISTLYLYKELGIENPEDAFHQYLQENLLPFAAMEAAEDSNHSREAEEDLITVIGGGKPKEREDLNDDYIKYLTDWLLTNKYHQLPQSIQQKVGVFVAEVIAQAQRKAIKMQTQQPILQDENSQMPPIRPKTFAGIDKLEPDVRAQVLKAMGYNPSQMLQLEMEMGWATSPSERINEAPPPVAGQPQPQPGQPMPA